MGQQVKRKKVKKTGFIKEIKRIQNKSRVEEIAQYIPKTASYLFEVWNFFAQRDTTVLDKFNENLYDIDRQGVARCLVFLKEFNRKDKDFCLFWAYEYGDDMDRFKYYCLLECLIIGLINALNVGIAEFYEFSFLDPKHKNYYREIGREINKIGGFSLMFDAANFLPKTHQAEIDCCWDGIGQWRW